MRKVIGFLAILSFVTACNGGGSDSKLPSVFSQKYLLKQDSGLNIADQSLAGNGSIALNNPLTPEPKASRNISLTLSLEDSGSLTLLLFADSKLLNSLPITIARSADVVTLSFVDASGSTQSSEVSLADPGAEFRLSFDIHNQETGRHSHLIAWQDSVDAPESGTAYLINEEEAAPGHGNYLGLTLVKAHMTSLVLSQTKSKFE